MNKLNNDLMGIVALNCNSWNDIFQLHLVNRQFYDAVLVQRFDLPWVFYSDDNRTSHLPKQTATRIIVLDLSSSTIIGLFAQLQKYHVKTIDIIRGIIDFSRVLNISLLDSQYFIVNAAKTRQLDKLNEQDQINLIVSIPLLAFHPPTPQSSTQPDNDVDNEAQNNNILVLDTTKRDHTNDNALKTNHEPPALLQQQEQYQSLHLYQQTASPSSTGPLLPPSIMPHFAPFSHTYKDINLDNYDTPKIVKEWFRVEQHYAAATREEEIEGDAVSPPVVRLLTTKAWKKQIASKVTSTPDVQKTIDEKKMRRNEGFEAMIAMMKAETIDDFNYSYEDFEFMVSVMKKYATRFIESVLLFGNHWFFITAIDGFMHNEPLDDAAEDGPSTLYEEL
ncbi:hypothetical protein BDC45DRAFT_558360 [Circinella umbellata]|nr:hypothetical protein BDC45DRAFT_558360 [Circinella umbellata]